MDPYQERVVKEKEELDDKLSRLRPFVKDNVFKTLPETEQERVIRQLGLMEAYSKVLGERIASFS
jgi:hypothetical protein